ncbi:TetR/AcrR family transcriptional regulator [Thalassiella azotivora]
MTSRRNKGATRGAVDGAGHDAADDPADVPTDVPADGAAQDPVQDPVQDAVLDAARELVLAVGVRRTTATDVARRAGISRMTLYRRYPDVQTVLTALLTREVTELLAAVVHEAGSGTARERLVGTALGMVRRLRDDPLLARILDVDPELLLPYVVDRSGTSQTLLRAALAAVVAQGQDDGSVRVADVDTVTRVVQLTVQSFVLSARVVDREADTEAVLAELAVLLERYLAP